jgi:glutaconyl-CoA/methylmalonyl-CoA decarboxylase subunit gamma
VLPNAASTAGYSFENNEVFLMKMLVKIKDKTYEVEIADLTSRPILATIEGETFEVWTEEVETITAHKASAPTISAPTAVVSTPAPDAAHSGKTVKAPIPGVILSLSVKEGDNVEAGQEICILEAMKMKNAIRASRSGKITAFHVSSGQTVRHGQPLFDLE